MQKERTVFIVITCIDYSLPLIMSTGKKIKTIIQKNDTVYPSYPSFIGQFLYLKN